MKRIIVSGIAVVGLLALTGAIGNGDPFWHLNSTGIEYNQGYATVGGAPATPSAFDVFTVGMLGGNNNSHIRLGEPYAPADGGAISVRLSYSDDATPEVGMQIWRPGDTILVNPVDGGILYEFGPTTITFPNGTTQPAGNPFQYGADAGTSGGLLSVTFPTAFPSNPGYCGCTDVNSTPVGCNVSTDATSTAVTFKIATARADKIYWNCAR